MEEKLPEGIIDKESYLEYKKLQKNPLLNDKKEIECSDGTIVNIALFPHILLKKIEHLPIDEKNRIMIKKQLYFKVNNKLNALKRKAFGNNPFQKDTGTAKNTLEARQTEIIELFGRMFTVDEVFKTINKDWGLQVSKETVRQFRIKHAEEIQKLSDKFRASWSDLRLGHKRSRLEELIWMFGRQKEKYIDKNNKTDDYRLLLATLEQIRKEAEGDRLTIDGKIDVNYEANIQTHLREEVFRTLNIKEIILGRVAARMNISPAKLIYSLNNSFYAKFSNVLGTYDENNAEGKDTVYPSQMNYDFERINKEFIKRDNEIEEAMIIEETKSNKSMTRAEEIQAAMLEKLKIKKDNINKMRSNVSMSNDVSDKNIYKDNTSKKNK